ncbi:MAG: hypothetical protein V7785_11960 [Bermanella sp.]
MMMDKVFQLLGGFKMAGDPEAAGEIVPFEGISEFTKALNGQRFVMGQIQGLSHILIKFVGDSLVHSGLLQRSLKIGQHYTA